MLISPLSLLAVWLGAASQSRAQKAGSIVQVGDTLVSAMMMFLGNEEKVYILDKVEGNAAQINGHAASASVWDINSHTATVMDLVTNAFCASGMHLPNGSYATFGGNGAIGPGGNIGSVRNSAGSGAYDATYQDYDGTKSIRVINPCTSSDNFDSTQCQWFDNPAVLAMQKQRWYSAAEPMADGTVVLIGGFVNGGYINRNYPNTDPAYEGGAAEPTYEFYPSNGQTAQVMQFMIKTSGLNAYAHTFNMPSGKMLVQANYSTMLWDPLTNTEYPLPDMPGQVVRVYPASGAVAMLPLTPANNYTPTVLFCGGSNMTDSQWGNYSFPVINTWDYPASTDCQRITPEPADGSTPAYEQDDDMLEGRTMGQFIALPNGKMLVVNGGLNGTAGYSTATGDTPNWSDMPYGMSLAGGPVLTPAIYDPNAPQGSRWSRDGLGSSTIPRLYHSSALLLPDASVMIAGSNPNVDVNISTYFPTTYTAEIFYPSYFAASTRPVPSGIPQTVSYGGDYFNITIPASSYSGSANDAADNTTVMLMRPGWTTHAMNMGQRAMQLNSTYTVNSDGSIVLQVAQAPPNPNLFQPGPALMFVVIDGIPSNGTMVTVGNGQIGKQPTSAASTLPPSVRLDSAKGSGSGGSSGGNTTSSGTTHTGAIIGGIVAAIAVVGVIGALFGICMARRRRAARTGTSGAYAMSSTGASMPMGHAGVRTSDSSAFMPLKQDNSSMAWGNQSTANLADPHYRDEMSPGYAGNSYGHQPSSEYQTSGEYDPYYQRR
ncbi:copper radical oxidase [Neolentinus lepideus HHB14362 ss-1]|uniref:Copper radical oxidase n=1 Tax=Neolentinus lepideus HHB14362 ss-1 TaxID=1314782 RepID=A0A165Q4P6_9AGAM|nr:copper radical oxidase [Neolentinus lepideus HHB14362 ss-1]